VGVAVTEQRDEDQEGGGRGVWGGGCEEGGVRRKAVRTLETTD